MENYEQKYKEALENFKKIKAANKDNKSLVDFIEYEYPELKENEDERVKENALHIIRDAMNGVSVPLPLSIYKECIAWLKKQGEQKCLNKTEVAEQFARIIRGHLTQIDTEVQIEFENLYTEITGRKMYGGYID